jgi:hypothetical protein
MDPSLTRLLVLFSALLASSPVAVTAFAQPSQGWALPASWASKKMPPKHALALCKQKILRFWGLTAQRGWARLILDQFHDLVLSLIDSTAATREPDSVSHEHHSYYFPDTGRGTANTSGFGWRGGSGV